MPVIDCRGLACPQPVVTTKKALEQLREGEMIVIVDNASSCNNVERFVLSQGCSVKIKEAGEDYYIHIHRVVGEDQGKATQPDLKAKKVVVYINSQLLGGGDEALGSFLMKAFLKTLLDLENQPSRLILVNSGVQLAAEGSKVLESLQMLSERGVEIVCCGTCIDFYKLKGKIRVGGISNMYDIMQFMLEADRVIRP
ncbi:MAG TPA: sulfurtransferase-like selenium metabolism protein YedF [Thermodesulfobacteriota bacterium]|nr:sulfurtransferase-like selenium metabolism protein YedF [Thermodesulfobacteriota bacterium]